VAVTCALAADQPRPLSVIPLRIQRATRSNRPHAPATPMQCWRLADRHVRIEGRLGAPPAGQRSPCL